MSAWFGRSMEGEGLDMGFTELSGAQCAGETMQRGTPGDPRVNSATRNVVPVDGPSLLAATPPRRRRCLFAAFTAAAGFAVKMSSLPLLAGLLALLLALTAACSPARDWRQMQPDGWSINVAMPCRPSRQERNVVLDAVTVSMVLLSCSGDGPVFAVAMGQLREPGPVGPLLAALVAAAQANVKGEVELSRPARVSGMTPFVQAREVRLQGRRPDGEPLQMQMLVFAHGLRVYQATVIGRSVTDEDVRPLFDSLSIKP
jgi:hypothetical protein